MPTGDVQWLPCGRRHVRMRAPFVACRRVRLAVLLGFCCCCGGCFDVYGCDVFYLTRTQGLSYEMANLSVRRGSVQPPVAVVSPQPGVRRGSTGSASINGRVYTNTGAGVGALDDDVIVSLEDSPWWVMTNERLRMPASRGSRV